MFLKNNNIVDLAIHYTSNTLYILDSSNSIIYIISFNTTTSIHYNNTITIKPDSYMLDVSDNFLIVISKTNKANRIIYSEYFINNNTYEYEYIHNRDITLKFNIKDILIRSNYTIL